MSVKFDVRVICKIIIPFPQHSLCKIKPIINFIGKS